MFFNDPDGLFLSVIFAIIYSIIATIALLSIRYFLNIIFTKLTIKVTDLKGTKIRFFQINSLKFLATERLISMTLRFIHVIRILIALILLYFYIPLVFNFFPWTIDLTPIFLHYVIDPLKTVFSAIIAYMPKIFLIVIVVFITKYILRFVKFIFKEISKGSIQINGFYKEWADPTYKLVRILIFVFALIIIFPYLPGADSPGFQGVFIFLGILFSLGSSSTIANIISGILLTYMRPFKVGDRVKISSIIGDVIEKNLLIIRVRTIKNEDITIPSSMVLGNHIINYSSSAQSYGLILTTTINIGYNTPWKIVHSLLIEAALKTTDILDEPKPFILQTVFNNFYIAYEINAYTHQPNRITGIHSELHQNIQDCFNEAGIEIMSPHYTAYRNGSKSTIPMAYKEEKIILEP